MNLIELHDNAKKVSNWRGIGYSQNENWVLKSVIPYKGTKTLLFQATCHGETVDGIHVVNLQFNNIKYFDTPPENGDIKEIEYKGEKYYFVRPTLENDVLARCSCPDFYYTFAYWNWKNKCIFGGMPKPYKRKTKNRKPRNPEHLPGICKHIYQLQSYLRTHDYLG